MSLLSRLREKQQPGKVATAIHATSATQQGDDGGTVARIATVAVANPKEGQTPPPAVATLTANDELTIRAWMAHMGETEAQIIGDYLDDCRHDPESLAYFLKRANEDLPEPVTDDDRRHCTQCANLRGGLCLAARQINITPPYRPNNRLPVRCAGYSPNAGDPDQRPGSERWPCLI